MSLNQKPYVTPTIETIDSSEILELIGPAQGYGHLNPANGMLFSDQQRVHSDVGGR